MKKLKKYDKGGLSLDGYKSSSKDKNKPFNVIPSGRITMKDVPHNVWATDNYGNSLLMRPGQEYQFPGQQVFEVPMKQTGGHLYGAGTYGMPNTIDGSVEPVARTQYQRGGPYIYENRGSYYNAPIQSEGAGRTHDTMSDWNLPQMPMLQNTGYQRPSGAIPYTPMAKGISKQQNSNYFTDESTSDYSVDSIRKQEGLAKHGGQFKDISMRNMKKGGAASGHPDAFWDGEKWVSSAGGSTWNNGVFYARGGSYSRDGGRTGNATFPPLGSGAMFANGGPTASFYVDGNGRPVPFAMAPGSGQGSGYLQDLPTRMNFGGIIPGAQLVNPFAMNPGPGTGSGMLQDLPTEIKKGGHVKGRGKKMSPQQMQMMMQAMQGQQGQPGMGAPMGAPGQPPMNMAAPPQMGAPGMMPQGQPMMMKGGKPCYNCGGMYQQGGQIGHPTEYYLANQLQTQMNPHRAADSTWAASQLQTNPNYVTAANKMYMDFIQQNPKSPDVEMLRNKMDAYNASLEAYNKSKKHQYGGMPDNDGDADVMKKGGNWIKGAVNPKHKGYCTPMTKATCTPRRKAFAMTMKRHHGFHEMGGLAKFMQTGGDPDPNYDPGIAPVASTYQPPTNTGVVAPPPDPTTNAPWRANMTDAQAQQNVNYGAGSTEAYDPATGNTVRKQANNSRGRNNWGYVAASVLGAGMGIASAVEGRRDEMNLRNKYFNDRSTANQYAAYNGPGGRGDYDQTGAFRPDQNVPTRAGYFPAMSEYGGSFAMGGKYSAMGGYHAGQELDLSDEEIQHLQRQGYKIQFV